MLFGMILPNLTAFVQIRQRLNIFVICLNNFEIHRGKEAVILWH